VEINPTNVRTARKNLASVGLDKTVTVIEGDALKVLPALEGGIDWVFIDALKPDYLKYFKSLEPKLVNNATLVADNVIVSARQMPDFLDYIQLNPNYDSVVIQASMHKNDGMLVAFKIR
jgi:predicted O-methyltransferase YrrM